MNSNLWLSWPRLIAAAVDTTIAIAATATIATSHAGEVDLAGMSPGEIKALQQRLTDNGCFQGVVDGVVRDDLKAARAQCPSQTPFLRIETGAHIGPIWRIATNSKCRLLATASEDKTLRTWTMPAGQASEVLRLPIGEGDNGKLYATALSPDGRWLAAGGSARVKGDTETVQGMLFEIDTKKHTTTGKRIPFGPFHNDINEIAFSRDSDRFAVGGLHGLQVFDIAGTELYEDRDYGAIPFGIDFGPHGAIVTASGDHKLRRYEAKPTTSPTDPAYVRTTLTPAPEVALYPYGLAIDSAGERAAVGYTHGSAVSIVDAKTLKPLYAAETADIGKGHSEEDMTLQNVAWSSADASHEETSGEILVAGGTAEIQQPGRGWVKFLRQFDRKGHKLRDALVRVERSDTITDIKPCGGGVVFADSGLGTLELDRSRVAACEFALGGHAEQAWPCARRFAQWNAGALRTGLRRKSARLV